MYLYYILCFAKKQKNSRLILKLLASSLLEKDKQIIFCKTKSILIVNIFNINIVRKLVVFSIKYFDIKYIL